MSNPKQIIRRDKAVEDVEHHANYIAVRNREAAMRFVDLAEQTINGLAQFPKSGSPFHSRLPELQGLRAKLVKGFPNYVVFYIEREDAIEVVRVLRGGQDMDAEVAKS